MDDFYQTSIFFHDFPGDWLLWSMQLPCFKTSDL